MTVLHSVGHKFGADVGSLRQEVLCRIMQAGDNSVSSQQKPCQACRADSRVKGLEKIGQTYFEICLTYFKISLR